ncbi:hypothetical protein H0H81_012391 [Sphagnurus paluster]|uniref:Uncharacterized protein n=1 Tax=Sphagnurus paluster TaxID=117069 RepID=A0A9P7FPV7_9AGAR|nr:hypothetical protein H0H81_012391 [Sphagnurus paluster]
MCVCHVPRSFVSIDGFTVPQDPRLAVTAPRASMVPLPVPVLPDGMHALTSQLIADDGDTSRMYTGPWACKAWQYQTGEQPYVTLPCGGAVHQAKGRPLPDHGYVHHTVALQPHEPQGSTCTKPSSRSTARL